jgi:hypothetical protein
LLNFNLITQKETTMAEMCGKLTPDDLRQLTNEMVDRMLGLIAECVDEDVTFVPSDPKAQDDFAATEAERNISWTLGHLIVHTTATAEEGAFLAAELARGVQREGRSRSEIPWETVTTIAQCRVRLEESRRMRLATLEVWPDQPHLDNSITLGFLEGPINPPARFALGLFHDHGHVKQIAEVVRQAQAARLE